MASRPESLRDLVVVIAGASSGFGRGAALKLGAQGAKVLIAARRKAMLDEVVAEITAAGGEALALETDVSQPDQVAALAAAAVERFGRVDVWVTMSGSARSAISGTSRSKTTRAWST